MGRRSTLTFRPHHRGIRVLLAEGDAASRFRLGAAFDRDGHDVVSVTSAMQLLFALQAVADGLGAMPEVVVADVSMGNGMAWAILREYRLHLEETRVIILTKHAAKGAFRELSPCDVVKRPIDEDALREMVEDARAPHSGYQLDVDEEELLEDTALSNATLKALRLDRGAIR